MRAFLQFPRSVIIAVVGMGALGFAVYFGIDATVNRAVSADADHKARGWASYFIQHMPNLDELIATVARTPASWSASLWPRKSATSSASSCSTDRAS